MIRKRLFVQVKWTESHGLLVAARGGRLTAEGSEERLNALRDLPIRTDPEPDLTLARISHQRLRDGLREAE